jgi:hypothetical protein
MRGIAAAAFCLALAGCAVQGHQSRTPSLSLQTGPHTGPIADTQAALNISQDDSAKTLTVKAVGKDGSANWGAIQFSVAPAASNCTFTFNHQDPRPAQEPTMVAPHGQVIQPGDVLGLTNCRAGTDTAVLEFVPTGQILGRWTFQFTA